MIHEFSVPFEVVTPVGDGRAIYVQAAGPLENDIWCVALKDGGRMMHFRTDQIRLWASGTWSITKDDL